MKKRTGIGLIELLISLFLSNLIMITLLQYYVYVKKEHQLASQKLEAQLDLQAIIGFMRSSIHQAGFMPCLTMKKLEQEPGTAATSPLAISADGSHIQTNRMKKNAAEILSCFTPEICITKNKDLQAGTPVLIADCFHFESNQITEIKKLGQQYWIRLAKPLYFSYQHPMYIGEWIQEQFFIHQSAKKRALYYQFRRKDELSNKIQAMHAVQKPGLIEIHFNLDDGQKIAFCSSTRN